MPETTSPHGADERHPHGTGVEPVVDYHDQTVNVRAILLIGGAIVAVAALAFVALALLLSSLTTANISRLDADVVTLPDATVEPSDAPPLQADEQADLRSYQAQEQQVLNSYGWVDEANGVVRVPIREAMRMLVDRGIEARGAEGAGAAREVEAPDWNSGQPLDEPAQQLPAEQGQPEEGQGDE